MNRVCAGLPGAPCTRITSKRRCSDCARQYESTRDRADYGTTWQRIKEQAIREHPWCSIPGCRNTDLTGDHIVPWLYGGRNVRSNVQILCRAHNSKKGARLETGAGSN